MNRKTMAAIRLAMPPIILKPLPAKILEMQAVDVTILSSKFQKPALQAGQLAPTIFEDFPGARGGLEAGIGKVLEISNYSCRGGDEPFRRVYSTKVYWLFDPVIQL